MCRALGSKLAELETVEENQDIVAYLQSTSSVQGIIFYYYLKLLNTIYKLMKKHSAKRMKIRENIVCKYHMVFMKGKFS